MGSTVPRSPSSILPSLRGVSVGSIMPKDRHSFSSLAANQLDGDAYLGSKESLPKAFHLQLCRSGTQNIIFPTCLTVKEHNILYFLPF